MRTLHRMNAFDPAGPAAQDPARLVRQFPAAVLEDRRKYVTGHRQGGGTHPMLQERSPPDSMTQTRGFSRSFRM